MVGEMIIHGGLIKWGCVIMVGGMMIVMRRSMNVIVIAVIVLTIMIKIKYNNLKNHVMNNNTWYNNKTSSKK